MSTQISVQGTLVYKKVITRDDEQRVMLSISDGNARYGLFVGLKSPLAALERGELVLVQGILSVSGQYHNIEPLAYQRLRIEPVDAELIPLAAS